MVTLCVLFNHVYPTNIPILRKLYQDRFSNLIFVHMGENGGEHDVVTSYRGSFDFQGLVADACERLLQDGSDLYGFVHDDVLLDPTLNESNIRARLGVEPRCAFLPAAGPIHGMLNTREHRGWNWIVGALWKMMLPANTLSGSGLRYLWRDLPAMAKTREQIGQHYGFQFDRIYYDPELPLPDGAGVEDPDINAELVRLIFKGIFDHTTNPPSLATPIPLFGGPSDLFAVDGAIMAAVARGLGLFAAANIFAEIAIPTVLYNVADHVQQAHEIGLKTDWGFVKEKTSVAEIAQGFRSGMLAYHPVKPALDIEFINEVLGCSQLEAHHPV